MCRIGSATAAVLTALAAVAAAADKTAWTLSAHPDPAGWQRVRAVLEVEGHLLGQGEASVPLQVEGEVIYDERVTESSGRQRRALRHYSKAEATIRINNRSQQPILPDDRRTIWYASDAQGHSLRSPHGPLRQQDRDLIDLPGSSAELPQLLPTGPVAIGHKWSPSQPIVALLLGVDQIDQGELTAELAGVQDQIAQIRMEGDIRATVRGAKTEMKVRGKLNIDVAARRPRWLALAINEQREAGPVGPGLKLQARLRMILAATEPPTVSVEPAAAESALGDDHTSRLQFRPAAQTYTLLHPPAWFVISDQADPHILRWLHDGRVLAQCRISSLHRLPAGRELGLEEFQRDIREALGTSFQQVVTSEQTGSPAGIRLLRVVVVGQVQEVPIQWIYYHLSHPDGRRAAMLFTLEADDIGLFGGADLEIVNSFEFLEADRAADEPAAEPQAGRPQDRPEARR